MAFWCTGILRILIHINALTANTCCSIPQTIIYFIRSSTVPMKENIIANTASTKNPVCLQKKKKSKTIFKSLMVISSILEGVTTKLFWKKGVLVHRLCAHHPDADHLDGRNLCSTQTASSLEKMLKTLSCIYYSELEDKLKLFANGKTWKMDRLGANATRAHPIDPVWSSGTHRCNATKRIMKCLHGTQLQCVDFHFLH